MIKSNLPQFLFMSNILNFDWVAGKFLLIMLCATCLACSQKETDKQTTLPAQTNTPKISLGEQLFTSNCTACHSNTTENGVGPGLKNVTKRRSKQWISAFIKNSQALIASGDKEAVALFNQYNKSVMTSFSFNEAEIDSLYTYLEKL